MIQVTSPLCDDAGYEPSVRGSRPAHRPARTISRSLSHTHLRTPSAPPPSFSFTHSLTPSAPPPVSLTLTQAHPLTLPLSLSHSLTPSFSPSFSLSLTHTLCLSLFLSLTHSHPLSLPINSSARVRLGGTACERTSWISLTSLECVASSGVHTPYPPNRILKPYTPNPKP